MTAEQLREALEAEVTAEGYDNTGNACAWIVDTDSLPRLAARLSRLDAGGGGEAKAQLGRVEITDPEEIKRWSPRPSQEALDHLEAIERNNAAAFHALSTQPRTEDGRTFEDGFEAAKRSSSHD